MKLFEALRQFFVGVGSSDLFKIYSNPDLYRRIKRVHDYPVNSGESKHDLVLIQTVLPFVLGPNFNIYAACLFDEERKSFENIVVTGFGRTSETREMDEQTETIPEPEIMRSITAAEDRISNNSLIDQIRNDPNEPNTTVAKMQTFSRYLRLKNLNQVACDSSKQNEDKQTYFICLGHPQSSTCKGKRSIIELRFACRTN